MNAYNQLQKARKEIAENSPNNEAACMIRLAPGTELNDIKGKIDFIRRNFSYKAGKELGSESAPNYRMKLIIKGEIPASVLLGINELGNDRLN